MGSEAVNNPLMDDIAFRSLRYYQNTFLVFNAFAINQFLKWRFQIFQ